MLHADDGLLHAYLDGELTGAERDRFIAHQAECAVCRTRLEEERALVARAADLLARAAPAVRAPAGFAAIAPSRAPRWRIPAAWAATVTLAFVMGWYVQGERLAHEVAQQAKPFEEGRVRISQPEVRAPVSNDMKTPRRSIKMAPTPPPATGAAREDAPSKLTARAATPLAPVEAAALRDEMAAWPAIDAAAARALLGRAPAVLPGRPIRRMARHAGAHAGDRSGDRCRKTLGSSFAPRKGSRRDRSSSRRRAAPEPQLRRRCPWRPRDRVGGRASESRSR